MRSTEIKAKLSHKPNFKIVILTQLQSISRSDIYQSVGHLDTRTPREACGSIGDAMVLISLVSQLVLWVKAMNPPSQQCAYLKDQILAFQGI